MARPDLLTVNQIMAAHEHENTPLWIALEVIELRINIIYFITA